MPTYTYECKTCFHTFDLFHGMNAKPRVKCEHCSGKCKRLIGKGAGIIFKGSGFYETDYKRKSGGNGQSTNGEDSARSGGEKDGQVESGGKSDSTAKSESSGKSESKTTSGDKAAAKD